MVDPIREASKRVLIPPSNRAPKQVPAAPEQVAKGSWATRSTWASAGARTNLKTARGCGGVYLGIAAIGAGADSVGAGAGAIAEGGVSGWSEDEPPAVGVAPRGGSGGAWLGTRPK